MPSSHAQKQAMLSNNLRYDLLSKKEKESLSYLQRLKIGWNDSFMKSGSLRLEILG